MLAAKLKEINRKPAEYNREIIAYNRRIKEENRLIREELKRRGKQVLPFRSKSYAMTYRDNDLIEKTNNKIRALNKNRKGGLSILICKKRMPYKRPTPSEIKVLSSEAKHRRTLLRRTPSEWVSAVAKLPSRNAKVQVAGVVIWDYFGNERSTSHGSAALDRYFGQVPFRNPRPDDLRAWFLAAGYSPVMIEIRLLGYLDDDYQQFLTV